VARGAERVASAITVELYAPAAVNGEHGIPPIDRVVAEIVNNSEGEVVVNTPLWIEHESTYQDATGKRIPKQGWRLVLVYTDGTKTGRPRKEGRRLDRHVMTFRVPVGDSVLVKANIPKEYLVQEEGIETFWLVLECDGEPKGASLPTSMRPR
jgi:hypothetical protein